ncbi:MAG: HAD-IIIA family hydrolase [Patescibacteria group bacterium]|mgnify:CR=1 FL=1
MRAVFLDRDGTINKEVNLLRSVRQLRILPGVARAIRDLNKLGFLVVVVTNQAVVARGWVKEREIDRVHAVLIDRLKQRGAKLDAIYYCPHHPRADLKKYRVRCRCRKPNVGMIKKAVRKFGINLRKSFIVGDHTWDILTGKRSGLKTILVKTGYGGKDGRYEVKPDFVVKNLPEAVGIIKKYAKAK